VPPVDLLEVNTTASMLEAESVVGEVEVEPDATSADTIVRPKPATSQAPAARHSHLQLRSTGRVDVGNASHGEHLLNARVRVGSPDANEFTEVVAAWRSFSRLLRGPRGPGTSRDPAERLRLVSPRTIRLGMLHAGHASVVAGPRLR
jgi:hypothetical protein